MKAVRGAAALRVLRGQPLWQLLAATKAPVVISLLRSLLFEADKTLPSSAFHERVARELDSLRASAPFFGVKSGEQARSVRCD